VTVRDGDVTLAAGGDRPTDPSPPEAAEASSATPWPRAIMHLDMDAFFAAVYLLSHPEDVGKPVAVGGQPGSRGVVAAASYEARQFGVHSGMPASRAARLCPNLKMVSHDWPTIAEKSRLVRQVLSEYGPVEPMSVDEAFVDLSDHDDPPAVAAAAQQHVMEATRLPASVGLATSKLVAKVASDFGKPHGCTIVQPGDEADFLAPLNVRVISGIGPRTAERLLELGIETCGDLADADLDALTVAMGPHAAYLPSRALGIDRRSVREHRGPPRSISAERTFSSDITDRDELLGRLRELSARVGKSLRRREMVAWTVTVRFRWADFTTFTRQQSVSVPIDADDDIYDCAQAIWFEHWPPGQPVRLIGVGVSRLEKPVARQLTLDL